MMPVTVDDIMNETPEDYAIRTAIPLQQAQTPAGAATQGIAFDELPDETYVRATSGSNKPEDQFDPLASLRGIVQPVLDNGQLGAAQITRGTTGVQALLGRVEYEAVKDDANARSMQALTLATQKADEGLWALDPRKFINATAQALPFLGATIGAGLAGAAGGAAVGAGAGLLGGPFAEVTVPGGALAGAKIGYDAGSASFSAAVMGGQTYMDLRDAGLSHETSRVGGIAAGIVMGAIERLQLHQLTGIGRKAVADQLATPAGKRALLQIVREGATVYGQQIAEEEAQEVAGILTQVIGSVAEGNSDAMPKLYDPAKPDDPNTILNRLKNTLVQTAYAVPGLAATSHVAGVATGKAVSAALGPNKTEVNTKGAQVAPVAAAVQKAKVGVSTVAEALALIKEGFAKPAPTAEAIKQTKEATMADTLDALVKPGVDEKGKVVQTETGPQIQASVTKETVFKLKTDAKALNNTVFYHGTNTSGITSDNIDSSFTKIESLFGRGVYLTDEKSIADGYAKARSRKEGAPEVYEVKLDVKNVLDLEQPASPDVREVIKAAADEWGGYWDFYTQGEDIVDEFGVPRPTPFANKLNDPTATTEVLLLEFTKELAEFSGQEGVSSTEFEDTFSRLEDAFSAIGFDALTHTGGKRTNKKPHQVVIVLNPQRNKGRIKSIGPVRQELETGVTKEAPAAAKPVNNKTLFRGQMDPTQSVTDKNISTTRSIADFIPAMKQMEKDIPTAGLVYFTESENVAKAYADQEKNIFKSMLAQNGQNREQTMEQFQILYGRPPKLEGRVIKQDVNVGKVLDLSDLGETPDFDTVVKRLLAEEGSPIPKFSTADGGVNSPTYDRFWELEKLFGLSKKYADPEGNDIATFKLMRNVDEAENSGNEFVKWVRDLGYDSVRYASQGTNHFAIINFDELQSSAKEAPAPTEPAKPTLETKGRETNVKDTLKTIDAAINDTERALISATADEKPTAAIRNKLDTLYAKRGVAQLELEQLAAGVATDVSGADITIKADRITALRAKAAKDAIKKFQQGVREGSKTARDTVKLVQAEVDSLIRASDLPAKDKGKFLARLRSITTEAQLTRALPEIKQRLDALIEKDAMRSAKRDLKRVLKQASERKAKRPEGKYTADVQTILDTYTQMIADPAKVEAALNVENPTGEREQLNKLIAEQVGDLENKNSDGVQRLADEIRSVIETGKSKRIEKTIAAKLETQALIADVTTSINGDKPVDSPSMATSKLRLKKWGENWLLKLDRAAGRFISTWADLMDIISQNDKTHAMVELMDVFPTIVEEEANQRKQFDAAIETLVDAVDPKPGESRKKTRQRVLNRLVEGGARVQDFGTFTDPDGREANLVVTRNEAAAIYAQSFDPDAAAGWDATYTRPDQVLQGQVSTLELLEKSLDDLDKQLVQGVINHFDGYHARINAAWEDETGATLPKNPFYSGQLRRVLENGEIEVVTAFNDYAAQSSLKPGSTIKRTKNANPLAPTDLYVNMFRQLHETEHWLAWRKTAKRLNVLRKNSKVRNTIKLKYGAGMLRTIDLHIDNMLQTKIKANEEAHKWLRHFRHNAGTAFVGGKALSAAKQFPSVLLFADHVSVPGYIAGVTDFFANPLDLARKIKILESAEHLKSRNTTMDVSTMDMIQSTDTKQFKTGMRFTDFLMLPVKFGDKATIWAGGWAVYAETLKKTKSHDQAIAAFERAFNATQSSGTTDQQTQLEASGEFGKAISLFTKNSVQIVNMERKALRRAIAQPSAKNVYHAAKTLAITRFSQILFQLASATPYIAGGDEDKIEEQLYKLFRAAMFGAWTGLPLIGDVLDSAGTVMTNITFDAKEKIWTPEFLPLEAAGDALTAFKNAAENLLADGQHNWDKIVGDGLSTWALVAPKAAGGGLPVTPLWSASKEFLFPEDDTGGNAPNLK